MLKNRYNGRIFLLNIPSLATACTLAAMSVASDGTEPLLYYRFIFGITTMIIAYSFFTVLIGSYISYKRLKFNSVYTYIDVVGEYLAVSEFTNAKWHNGKFNVYKKLWIAKLSDIEDVYYYDRDLVVLGPARLFEEPADWLEYSRGRTKPEFHKWWYNENGGKNVHSIEIRNKFSNPERIIRVIENSCGTMQKKEQKRREYREHMLKIARQLNRLEK